MKKQSVFTALMKSAGLALLFIASQFLASLIAQSILTYRLALQNGTEDLYERLIEANNANVYLIMILSGLIFVGLLFLIWHKDAKKNGVLHAGAPDFLIAGTALGFGAFYIASLIIAVLSLLPAVTASQEAYMEQQNAIAAAQTSLLPELVYVVLFGPIVEELLCRGAILGTLKKSMSPAWAITLSALVFALIHGNLYQIVFTLPLGLLLGALAHVSGSVWPSVALHCAFNFSNYLMQPQYLGLSSDTATMIYSIIATVFFVIHIPLGIVFFVRALRRHKNDCPSEEKEGNVMPAPSHLIVGLGNPGDRYENTRHNSGFIALDYIAERLGVRLDRLRYQSLTADAVVAGKKVLLMKPQTFMNLSGDAVSAAAAFYHIPPENILVLADDINFAPGVFRIRTAGSSGGHNGLRDIAQKIGSESFPRVKIGVGQKPDGWDLAQFVLSKFPPADLSAVLAAREDIFQTALLFCQGDLPRAASLYNGKPHA